MKKKDQEESAKNETEPTLPKYQHKGNAFLRVRTRKDKKDLAYKTAVLIDNDVIPENANKENVASSLAKKLETVPGNRPVAKFGSPARTPQKRPGSIYTPRGTKFTREKSYGCILIFSNRDEIEASRPQAITNDSSVKEILKEPFAESIKSQEIIVTADLLDAAAKERAAGNVRGRNKIPSQNETMARSSSLKSAASATKIASALGIRSEAGELWEWLHLIAFMIKGRNSQQSENLSGGTQFANTDMIFAEDELVYLAHVLQEEIKLYVESKEVGCHFAKEIQYKIETKKFTLTFVFDAQTSIQPSLRNQEYIHALVETLIEESAKIFRVDSKEQPESNVVLSSAVSPTMPTLFFKSQASGQPNKARNNKRVVLVEEPDSEDGEIKEQNTL